MRVSFFGKGGSGKTTVSSAFTKYLVNKNEKVLAIDADMNVHFSKIFNLETKLLSNYDLQIMNYFEMNRKSYIGSTDKLVPIIGCTPPAINSKFVKINKDDSFLKTYATIDNNLFLLSTGTYNEQDAGASCYHGKLEVIELLYHRLLDNSDDFVVCDSTAGIDSLGTSMFFVSDINIFVVEPTKKGISVYLDFKKIADLFNLKTLVIGNKIEDEEDIIFLEENIGKENIIGNIKSSSKMRKYEQGKTNMFEDFVKENNEVFDRLFEILKSTSKDWDKYYNLLLEVYKSNAKNWYNDYFQDDLERYIDPDFSYDKVIKDA